MPDETEAAQVGQEKQDQVMPREGLEEAQEIEGVETGDENP